MLGRASIAIFARWPFGYCQSVSLRILAALEEILHARGQGRRQSCRDKELPGRQKDCCFWEAWRNDSKGEAAHMLTRILAPPTNNGGAGAEDLGNGGRI